MGHIRHDAIVVTSWNSEALEATATKARECGLRILGPSAESTNGFRTLLVCPDGSKEGWEDTAHEWQGPAKSAARDRQFGGG